MPKLTTFLPDVNVWLALASSRHIHSQVCSEWLNSLGSETVVFCRVSQMGLLRLLTNESAMGKDVLSSREAWHVYTAIVQDQRVSLLAEPFNLEPEWRKLMSQDKPVPKVWTDAYLAAFAISGGMQLVTLDRAVLSLTNQALLLI